MCCNAGVSVYDHRSVLEQEMEKREKASKSSLFLERVFGSW